MRPAGVWANREHGSAGKTAGYQGFRVTVEEMAFVACATPLVALVVLRRAHQSFALGLNQPLLVPYPTSSLVLHQLPGT